MNVETLRKLGMVDQYIAAVDEVADLEDQAELATTLGLVFTQYPELKMARRKLADITYDLINLDYKPVYTGDSFRDYLEPL